MLTKNKHGNLAGCMHAHIWLCKQLQLRSLPEIVMALDNQILVHENHCRDSSLSPEGILTEITRGMRGVLGNRSATNASFICLWGKCSDYTADERVQIGGSTVPRMIQIGLLVTSWLQRPKGNSQCWSYMKTTVKIDDFLVMWWVANLSN